MKNLKLIQFIVVIYTFLLTSCTDHSAQPIQAKQYVLVHGAWQAPYAWESVKSGLESQGNKVVIVELPGHGNDQTPPEKITLDTYKEKVIAALSAMDGKVILAGHSLGGMIISSVAESVPGKIEKLVYIAAYLPASGQTLDQLAHTDADSQLGADGTLIFNKDGVTVDVKQDRIVDLFIQDGTPEIQNLVLKNYRTEPLIPFINPVTLTDKNFGSVEKVYIKTLQDHVISPSLQNSMIMANGVKTVYEINSGHSPFLSKPDLLTALLIGIK
ncbi:Pimeloyl-ACP methyl ester carboxylesterase [Dyadobacter soli]|uniref:Pimeloyl-ACP methyl ester carboxylesterase n=1 Tax=Dyadobacter soli TaxID=659014 RepID=A0A1G7AAK9_9BACT|nr:alpha/beta fold hydrolase [Dyadobacter soli]SDE11839.1 Pimeloyl-ACP methyl ester carboxylesterase [Dyadobacter soli]